MGPMASYLKKMEKPFFYSQKKSMLSLAQLTSHFATNSLQKPFTKAPHSCKISTTTTPPVATMDGGENLYRLLLDRCQSLEASHQELRRQFDLQLQQEHVKNNVKDSNDEGDTSYSGRGYIPGVFFVSPHMNVLDHLGHAVHVSKVGTGEIIYWSRAAERLYGYKDYEVLGLTAEELLIDEEHRASARRLLERLRPGQPWSGQFPFKKRSGRIFMALVTQSLLYEDCELVGIVTVSSDAAVFNKLNLGNVRIYEDPDDGRTRVKGINLKKIPWEPQPEVASSVNPNLTSKVLVREDRAWTNGSKEDTEQDNRYVKFDRSPEEPAARTSYELPVRKVKTDTESSEMNRSARKFMWPSKIAAKVLSKLRIGKITNVSGDKDGNMQQSGYIEKSVIRETYEATTVYNRFTDADHDWAEPRKDFPFTSRRAYLHLNSPMVYNRDLEDGESRKFSEVLISADQLNRSSLQPHDKEFKKDVQRSKLLGMEDELQQQALELQKYTNTVKRTGIGAGSSSSKFKTESNFIVNCGIHWEDLNLREVIGEGSYGIVYHGIWNGSDVAVKVYSGNYGNQCSAETFLDYKKEIDIMRRLRHPNVLLFMGAVYSQEKLAVVTEYMPRGSLFKTLHKSNQPLDIKKRLRMALDVARGMNYLHHRNPPIVHRDLKSSNLLVDKSWTVKVGDFGLSRLKMATFLSVKSDGGGTAQWMAPEVLRSEPSTEKSDVFSFGVVLWELMTESVPWDNLNPLQIVAVVGFMDHRLDIPANLDPRVSSIIQDCWLSNPEQRPSFEEIIHRMTNLIQTVAGETAMKRKDPED